MAGELLIIPFRPAINIEGNLESGAKLNVYRTDSLDRVTVYADAELTTPLSNPVVANSFGLFPSIYFPNGQPLRLVLTDSEDVLIGEVDPYVVGIETNDTVTPEQFGARSIEDGAPATESQTNAIRDALESGKIVDFGGKTYTIGATCAPTSGTVRGLINGKFVRAVANQTSQSAMLSLLNQPNIVVDNCWFDFGVTENTGSTDDSARVLLAVGSNNSDPISWVDGISVSRCKFTGAGNGTALFVRGTKNVRITQNSVVDRIAGGNPSNDTQNGIDITHSIGALVQGNTVNGLYLREGGVPIRKFSRGILVTNSQNIRLLDNLIANCDQCVDFSGGISVDTPVGNSGFVVANNICHDFRTWGIKFANCVRNGICVGNTIRNFGYGGIIVSGQSAAWVGSADLATQNITIASNFIYDPADYFSRTDCIGIWIVFRVAFPGYPVRIRVLGNTIINTTGNGRLLHGVAQDDGDGAHNVVAGAPYNEVRDNRVTGATSTATLGCVPDGLCVVTADSSQTIASGTWEAIQWNVETIDGQGMHSNSSNLERITPGAAAGWFLVTATIAFNSNTTGVRSIRLRKNGGSVPGGEVSGPSLSVTDVLNSLTVSCVVYLGPSDNVRVEAYQNSGDALNVLRENSQFSIRRLEQI